MKPVNEQIRRTLANFTKGLKFAELGNLNPFIWETEIQGELTTEKLILLNKVWGIDSLELIEIDSFNQPSWLPIINAIKASLREIEVYQAYFPDNGFCIFIGKTTDGEWFGISTSFNYELKTSGRNYVGGISNQFLREEITPYSQSALRLIEFL